jgi:hypothetical protein
MSEEQLTETPTPAPEAEKATEPQVGGMPAPAPEQAPAPVTDNQEMQVPKISITVQKLNSSDAAETFHLGPNYFNVLVWLLNFRDEHKADKDSFMLSCSEIVGADGKQGSMTIDAMIAEFDSKTLGFQDIQAVLRDCINFLMMRSTLAGITLSACFIHPKHGPSGVSLSSSNTYIDNPNLVEACTNIAFTAAANSVAKFNERKRSEKAKGIIMPDKKIIVPGSGAVPNPAGIILT